MMIVVRLSSDIATIIDHAEPLAGRTIVQLYQRPNMGGVSTSITLAGAYRQLRPSEKAFVDGYVADIERDAHRRSENISLALHRAIPLDVIERSRGMLEKPMVRAAITERIQEIAASSELAPQRVVKEWMAVGFASIGDYMQIDEGGQPWFDLARCTPEQLSAIQSIEVEETLRGRKFKFKLHDKLSALEKLGRVMGLLEADNPTYRAMTAKPVGPAANDQGLPANVTQQQAGDLYAAMING